MMKTVMPDTMSLAPHPQSLVSVFKRATLIPLLLLLAACVTPPATTTTEVANTPARLTLAPAIIVPPAGDVAKQQALRSLINLQDRLYRVAAPLLVNGTDLCTGNARKLLGFSAKNKYSFPDEFIEVAQKTLDFDDRLRITSVLAGSGAAAAGLQLGDTLVAIADKPIPQGDNAERQVTRILGPLITPRTKALKLTVNRNGANLSVNVPLTVACAFGIELGNADHVNAYGDGRRVLVTRGMMAFAQTDDQLAYVLAKELAHNALSHASKQKMNATMGGVIDNLIRMKPDMSAMAGTAGIKPLSREFDIAADNLSLYFLVRAGYDPEGAIAFWQRLSDLYPINVTNGYTAIHPSTAYRLIAMEKNLAILRSKQAADKPLVP